MNASKNTKYTFGQTKIDEGKVRDLYVIDDKLLVMIVTDRISVFDAVLPVEIPGKGQILNRIAVHFLQATQNIVPNWLLASPHPNVSIGRMCEPYPIEMVVRGYLSGHAARVYEAGNRMLCGVCLPEGLNVNDPLPEPIITPTLKAKQGQHDTDISAEELITGGSISAGEYEQLAKYSLDLYAKGVEMAAREGLILADTKYEFGKQSDKIYLIDEVHTPDSSRFFYTEDYELCKKKGISPRQLSKEYVRAFCIEKGFADKKGLVSGISLSDEFIKSVSARYSEVYKQLIGSEFKPVSTADIEQSVNKILPGLLNEFNKDLK